MLRIWNIRPYERGLVYVDGVFSEVLKPGWAVRFDPLSRLDLERRSIRDVWLEAPDLDVIVRTEALADETRVLDLAEYERALVWVDGRFDGVVGAGLRVLWTAFRDVRVERFDARDLRYEGESLQVLANSSAGRAALNFVDVPTGWIGLWLVEDRLRETLIQGRYAFWDGVAKQEVRKVDLRERVLDVAGQDVMTADKVTLRMNATAVYRVADPVRASLEIEDVEQALYRDAQLVLRAAVGGRDLEEFLSAKETLADELKDGLASRARDALGVEIVRVGIRDVILPGEMKTILNRVTEARKAAEADLIVRREETAAMRSQANTARIFESNPALMRLRELEVLEKVADKANLNVVLGESGLTDKIVKLL